MQDYCFYDMFLTARQLKFELLFMAMRKNMLQLYISLIKFVYAQRQQLALCTYRKNFNRLAYCQSLFPMTRICFS